MIFIWDENKNRTNRRKHGLSFETAALAFEDPLMASYVERVIDGEERWHMIGYLQGVGLVLVAHAVEDENGSQETIRITSARKAGPGERTVYNAAH